MTATLNKNAFPAWTKYVVILFASGPGDTLATAPCSTIERVVDCMIKHDCALSCEVVRFEDDKTVWPIESKGGTA